MTFARKMPEFYIKNARTIFFPEFGEGARALCPRLLRLCVCGSAEWKYGLILRHFPRYLDFSYLGLFVPSWTVRTMDYSYHHWTIRTVMQYSQKFTFPSKMCLCSV